MRTRTLLLAMLAASPLSAQQATSTTAGTSAPPAVVPAPSAVPAARAPDAVTVVEPVAVTSVTKSKDTLSVDFPDEDIRTILRNVADLFELNLVIPDTLQGKTSLKLRDVSWRQIFQVVLSPVGYTFVEDGNIIKVVSQDSLAAEPVSTEVFIINYAKAEDISKTVTALVDSGAGGEDSRGCAQQRLGCHRKTFSYGSYPSHHRKIRQGDGTGDDRVEIYRCYRWRLQENWCRLVYFECLRCFGGTVCG